MTIQTPASNATSTINDEAGAVSRPGTASLGHPILVVDDDETTCDVIRAYLDSAGYRVLICRSGTEALDVVRQTEPRCLILDVMLPGKDGFKICQEIRASGSIVPILLLSARADEPDRVGGLRAGADDYLVKPFSPRELLARVDALLRRAEIGPRPPVVVQLGNIELSPTRHDVTVDGRCMALTHVEFRLLAAMLEQPGWVLSRGQLIDRLYTDDRLPALDRTVDVHVFRLREKLHAAHASVAIVTIRGLGYKIIARGS
ncbi:MAG TPA: response regulator transcription factor [Candidatus Saccharimonadales bacterium]|nr:response regulator transcription factor [Candidatus Saccharimonadales bacterium]